MMAKKQSNASENQTEISEALTSQNEPESAENFAAIESETESFSSDDTVKLTDRANSEIHREQMIDFWSLPSDLTIEEVQEEAQIIEEENLSTESPLDRYVRKHRDVVESGKNAFGKEKTESDETSSPSNEPTKVLSDESVILQDSMKNGLDPIILDDESESDTSTVDEDLLEGELVDTTIFPAPTLTEVYESELAEEKKFDELSVTQAEEPEEIPVVSPVIVPVEKPTQEVTEVLPIEKSISRLENEKVFAADVDEISHDESKRSLKKPIIIGLLALTVLGVGAFTAVKLYQDNQAKSKATAANSSAAVSTFKKGYEAFFTDSSHTALKNSGFSNLSALGDALNAIPTTDSNFSSYQTQYNNLTSDISSIKSVNALFDKNVIIDGKLDASVTVKNAVTIPTLSSKNSTLNALLQQALGLAKSQQTAASVSAAASSAAAVQAAAQSTAQEAAADSGSSASNTATTTESATNSNSASDSTNTSTDTTTSVGSVYSQNPTGATPDNSGSRVPIQSINPNNAAFQWATGVLDVTIASMQSRGYISGSNYILEPVAIDTAGDGWYNIYRPDGSYLFSINCKTGFWAGNGGKHPNLPATFN